MGASTTRRRHRNTSRQLHPFSLSPWKNELSEKHSKELKNSTIRSTNVPRMYVFISDTVGNAMFGGAWSDLGEGVLRAAYRSTQPQPDRLPRLLARSHQFCPAFPGCCLFAMLRPADAWRRFRPRPPPAPATAASGAEAVIAEIVIVVCEVVSPEILIDD